MHPFACVHAAAWQALHINFKADDLNPFYGCGTWDDEGLAEAHDELDGREEEEAEERLLTRLGMSELRGL